MVMAIHSKRQHQLQAVPGSWPIIEPGERGEVARGEQLFPEVHSDSLKTWESSVSEIEGYEE